MAFRGFPRAAIAFFEGLEADNSKAWWTEHKAEYEEAVRGPMEELIAAVDERYRPMRIFRPYRDTRFSKDKTPYKTNIAAAGEAEGVEGLWVAAGHGPWGISTGPATARLVVDAIRGRAQVPAALSVRRML